VDVGSYIGNATFSAFEEPDYFVQYEEGKWMIAAEYTRVAGHIDYQFYGLPIPPTSFDERNQYAMATYKVTTKFSAGIYNSESFNRSQTLGPLRFSKDWALSARYDFNQFLYAKAEQHFIDGTAIVYDSTLNPNGLKPDTRLTVFKAGISF
jgi:hypothetical protein